MEKFSALQKLSGPIDVRIVKQRPVAKNQWALWVKREEEELPEFELGNFCMLSMSHLNDPLIPRPFAIVDREEGGYQFIYRVHGKFTQVLQSLPPGSKLSLLGPLGRGISRNFISQGRNVFVAGGVGFASLLPCLQFLGEGKKSQVEVFYGVREELEIIRRSAMNIHYSSDDGSIGLKGRITEVLKKNEAKWRDADQFFVCGPTPMMKAVYDLIPKEKSFYFLEETMGCGVGLCVGCVVPLVNEKGECKRERSCIEGPIVCGTQLSEWRKLP